MIITAWVSLRLTGYHPDKIYRAPRFNLNSFTRINYSFCAKYMGVSLDYRAPRLIFCQDYAPPGASHSPE